MVALLIHPWAVPRRPNRPRLRRAPGGGTIPVDENGNEQPQKDDQDERPTLKRRDS